MKRELVSEYHMPHLIVFSVNSDILKCVFFPVFFCLFFHASFTNGMIHSESMWDFLA